MKSGKVKVNGSLKEIDDFLVYKDAGFRLGERVFLKKDTKWVKVWDCILAKGIIVMYDGALNDLPPGFALCDGNNGTPNLTDSFIKAAAAAGISGGSNTHSHSLTSADNHSHTIASNIHAHSQSSRHSVQGRTGSGNWETPTGYAGAHTHTPSASATHNHSGLAAVPNEPSYYTLAFIMKT